MKMYIIKLKNVFFLKFNMFCNKNKFFFKVFECFNTSSVAIVK